MATVRTSQNEGLPDAGAAIPLVVDLDGTLIRTDLLFEGLIRLLRRRPLFLFLLVPWLLRGRAVLKAEVARRVPLEGALLPWRDDLVRFLVAQRDQGRRLVLATASDARNAQHVAGSLGFFADVLASDGVRNLKGRSKAAALVARYGDRGFDYAGNDNSDVAVWRHARRAVVVGATRSVEKRARRLADVECVIGGGVPAWLVLARALRVHQWVKNLLVYVPLLAAHAWRDVAALGHATLAFVAFCAAASALYLVNDALDLDADRAHPRKRHRPLAAGDLSLPSAAVLVAVLLLVGGVLAALVSSAFVAVVTTYFLVNIAYSFWLKTRILVDVLGLAGLYTLRVIGGAVATAIVPSFWLLAFSMFIFVSLALIKRCAELRTLADGQATARGRDYGPADLYQLTSLGTAAGCAAVVILALYIHSEDVVHYYAYPQLLWLLCPLVLYWIGRMWVKCGRGQMHDDPIVFSARDRASWFVLTCSAILVTLAS